MNYSVNELWQGEKANDTNAFRYSGEYYDAETGLIYLRARYYSPSIGRFITVDPIKDGTNWYVYCSNNPVAFVDPSGRSYQEAIDILTNLYNASVKMENNDDGNHESIYAAAYEEYLTQQDALKQSYVYVENWGELRPVLTPAVNNILSSDEISKIKAEVITAKENQAKSEFSDNVIFTAALTVAIVPVVKIGISSTTSLLATNNNTIVNLSNAAAQRMANPNRYVPASILKTAIEHGVASPDPKGSRAIMYTIEMFRGNKAYTLEVLYDAVTDTIWHFVYK